MTGVTGRNKKAPLVVSGAVERGRSIQGLCKAPRQVMLTVGKLGVGKYYLGKFTLSPDEKKPHPKVRFCSSIEYYLRLVRLATNSPRIFRGVIS